MQSLSYFQQAASKWIDPKEFDLNKYTSNSLKGCVLKDDLEHSQELKELHNHYPLAPDKIEIKREILLDYQLTMVDLLTPLLAMLTKTAPNFLL